MAGAHDLKGDEQEPSEVESVLDIQAEAKRRGIQLPEYSFQPAGQSMMSPSLHRENGFDSLHPDLPQMEPPVGSQDILNELPEATVDEMADLGLFVGEGGLKLFNSLVERERTTDENIRETVRQRQAAKSLPPVPPFPVNISDLPAATPEVSIQRNEEILDQQPLPAQSEVDIPEIVVWPATPQVGENIDTIENQQGTHGLQEEPQPVAAASTSEAAAPNPQRKKRRRKPRKQRSPSPPEDVEFPAMHRDLIRHKHKLRKVVQNQPHVRALTSLMMDILAGLDDYGFDCTPYPLSDDEPLLVVDPAHESPKEADIPELEMPIPEINEFPNSSPREGVEIEAQQGNNRPRFDTMASILSPSVSLAAGIRDFPPGQPSGKGFTAENIAYSLLKEKSKQALMTPEEKAMNRDEQLKHKIRKAKEDEAAKKAAASGSSKPGEPEPEVLYRKVQRRGETMVRYVGLDGKVEEQQEYAVETASVYFQIRFFMKKHQWRMKWDDIWQNFQIPEKNTTKKLLEMRLYYLSEKGLIFLHCDDEGGIVDVEIKVKPKADDSTKSVENSRTKKNIRLPVSK